MWNERIKNEWVWIKSFCNYLEVTDCNTNRGYKVPPDGVSVVVVVTIAMVVAWRGFLESPFVNIRKLAISTSSKWRCSRGFGRRWLPPLCFGTFRIPFGVPWSFSHLAPLGYWCTALCDHEEIRELPRDFYRVVPADCGSCSFWLCLVSWCPMEAVRGSVSNPPEWFRHSWILIRLSAAGAVGLGSEQSLPWRRRSSDETVETATPAPTHSIYPQQWVRSIYYKWRMESCPGDFVTSE